MENKIFYNQEELAERWGMSPRTLENWRAKGEANLHKNWWTSSLQIRINQEVRRKPTSRRIVWSTLDQKADVGNEK